MIKRTLYKVVFDTGNGVHCPSVQVASTDATGDDVIRLARLAADMEAPPGLGSKEASLTPIKMIERLGSVFTE